MKELLVITNVAIVFEILTKPERTLATHPRKFVNNAYPRRTPLIAAHAFTLVPAA